MCVGSFASVFLISIDSARPDVTKTCTLLISFLRSLLDQRVGQRVADVGDDFARLRIDGVDGNDAAHRALTALDGIHLVAEIDRRVRREDLDLVDVEAAEAVEDLFGQLVAFADDQLGLLALERECGPSWS